MAATIDKGSITAKATLENTLKSTYGVVVVRVNPDVPETYQKVEIDAVSVVIPTQETV